MSFAANRSLLNPKFEGYKFNPLSQTNPPQRYGLPYHPTQTNPMSTHSMQPMSFQEVQSRIKHNHISTAVDTGMSVYVDEEYRVITITINHGTFHPSFSVLYELPKPVRTASVADHDIMRPEYPSSVFIQSSTLLVADGHGMMYILALPEAGEPVKVLAIYELQSLSIPFRIHQCVQTSPSSATVVISSKNYQNTPSSSSTKHKSVIEFDLRGVSLALPIQEAQGLHQMDVRWHRRAKDIPIFITYNEIHNSFLLFGDPLSPSTTSLPSYTPTPDEMAPIPRLGEDLDGSNDSTKPPPPYSWTQSSDSLTMAFPLPSSTQKNDIKVAFTPRTLSVLVTGGDETTSPIPLPRYPAKILWDSILPSTSFWTWDREGEKSFGLLTLHIDKQHEGTRWVQVFAANPESPELEVEETLDPSELYNIREALEKHTSSLPADASGAGLGSGVPSLGKGEVDDELDASVGRMVYMTTISAADNPEPPTAQPSLLTLLSTPLPGLADPEVRLIVKNGIDGLVYTLHQQEETWVHTSTFSALAFVLASKQDTRFTHHISSRTALAFESGSRGPGFNVYVYEAAPSPRAQWAKQSVLRVGDSSTGPLLGLSAVRVQDANKTVILCLCENELVLIHEFAM